MKSNLKSFNERTITFTIESDHTYTVEFVGDAEVDVKGSYVISGTQITFNDDSGDYSSVEPGVYEFEVSETSVKFTMVSGIPTASITMTMVASLSGNCTGSARNWIVC